MKRRWTGEQNWVTFLLVFVVLLIVTGMFYPKEVRLIPYVVGFPTLVLLLSLWIGGFNPVVKRWVEKAAKTQKASEEKTGKPEQGSEFTEWRPVLIVMAWVFPFFILVFLFGFALLNYPLLSLFKPDVLIFGLPLLYVYVFGGWCLLIGLTALVMVTAS